MPALSIYKSSHFKSPEVYIHLLLLLCMALVSPLIARAQDNNNQANNNSAVAAAGSTAAASAQSNTTANTRSTQTPSVTTTQPSTSTAGATSTTGAPAPLTVAGAASAAEASPVPLKVTAAYRDDPADKQRKRDSGLYDYIILEIEGLAQWDAAEPTNDPASLVLFLDGKPLRGIRPEVTRVFENKLRYQLMRTPESKEQWSALLGRPGFSTTRMVTATVGIPDAATNTVKPVPSTATMNFTMINKWGFWAFWAILALVLVAFFKWYRDSLRDPSATVPIKKRPYSLGRCQMAFWFFLVAASYVFIWMVTSDYGVLPESVLILIGVSAGTALGASVVNSNKRNDAERKLTEAETDLETVTRDRALRGASPGVLPPTPGAASLAVTEPDPLVERLNRKIEKLAPQANPRTQGSFRQDIFRDSDGSLSFPRIQIVIWTLVLGLIFVAEIYNRLTMPDFPGALLALMGISSGTYIGLKIPDQEP